MVDKVFNPKIGQSYRVMFDILWASAKKGDIIVVKDIEKKCSTYSGGGSDFKCCKECKGLKIKPEGQDKFLCYGNTEHGIGLELLNKSFEELLED
jgi:hypothetical protein